MNLYINEYGAKIKKSGGKLVIEKDSEILGEYPLEKLESITLFTTNQITSQCIEELAENNVSITWLSYAGKLVGCLYNPDSIDINRQKCQFDNLSNHDLNLEISKKIINAKIHNQRTFLYRQNTNAQIEEVKTIISTLDKYKKSAEQSKSIEEILGHEGNSANKYYEGLRYFIPKEYNFARRTKNPPLDCVSSVLSFAYTLLFNDLFLAINNAGLNPYVGVMHKLRNGHPALVSDLMEEWRPIISDAIAMDILKNHITTEDFQYTEKGAVYLNKSGSKKLISLYEKKMHTSIGYVKKEGVNNSFRGTLSTQIYEYIKVIESQNVDFYNPILSR